MGRWMVNCWQVGGTVDSEGRRQALEPPRTRSESSSVGL